MNKIFALPALLLTITACTNPEKRVHQLLTERMETLAVAESCTGGSIAARLMATPGAVFVGDFPTAPGGAASD